MLLCLWLVHFLSDLLLFYYFQTSNVLKSTFVSSNCSFRTNRTHLKYKFYAIGALKKGKPDEPFEDNIPSFLSMESISDVTLFNRTQFGDAVFHSRMYQSFKTKQRHYSLLTRRRHWIWPDWSLLFDPTGFSCDMWGCHCPNVKDWQTCV